ncbi:MAG: MmcQ/YjbR family DNA-binding protein [Alphaproteobacteria bacterium]|nr:MmcQ/YjbR family DNA-binding protein [Alphaproteobacteria bacterium]
MTPKQFHALVLSFPETVEAQHYGYPSYKAFGKFLVRLRAEDDSIVLGLEDFDERDMLLEAEPETFHITDHYRSFPYVLARLKQMDAKRLRGYLTRRWRKNAPKTWLRKWDAEQAAAEGGRGTGKARIR